MKKRAAGRQHRESSGSTNKRVAEKLLAQDERYLHLADLESYLDAHMRAARLYQNRSECYEEVPETWAVRIKQIMRWAKGHNQAMVTYAIRLLVGRHRATLRQIGVEFRR